MTAFQPAAWETPELTATNRLPARATLFPFATQAQARALDPAGSPWHRSLDGQWRFSLYPRPEAVPEPLRELVSEAAFAKATTAMEPALDYGLPADLVSAAAASP